MRRRAMLEAVIGTAILATSGAADAQGADADVKASLAPTGTIRFAINYGNAVLARRDSVGTLCGVSVDIARELSRRLNLPFRLVPFDEAGNVSAAATNNVWDVAFLARDPRRAQSITFTAAYVVIDGSYVVRRDSPIISIDQVDQDGVRIAVSANSAYDLFLTRTLKHARLVRADNTPETTAVFRSERLEVLAGVKQALQQVVASDVDLRIIAQPFMQIDQAMCTPAGRPAGAAYLAAFVEDIKANGFVAQVLTQNGQGEATIAPPG